MNVETANLFFAFLSLAALALAVAIPIGVLAARRRPDSSVAVLLDDLRPVALWLAFSIAAISTLGSLYYSEVQDYTPCLLCWYQRIAMYPLAVILGIAAFRDDHLIKFYALPVAAVGAAVSTYHYQLELFPDQGSGVCAVDVPCTVRWFEVFGFISLAFMALTGFLAIIALLSIARPRPLDEPLDEAAAASSGPAAV
ncbi:MAG: disulfide bond formation protein B [Acidimicrobiales bacterium]|nr:disulfide bond formation protein B [Acidimicrobiales bacterium]